MGQRVGEVTAGEQYFTTSVPKPQTQKGAHSHTHIHSLSELPRPSFSSVVTCSKQPYLVPRKRALALARSCMGFKHMLSFLSSALTQHKGHCPGSSLAALLAFLYPRFFEACSWSIWAAQPCPLEKAGVVGSGKTSEKGLHMVGSRALDWGSGKQGCSGKNSCAAAGELPPS